jgi:hypothetical protein
VGWAFSLSEEANTTEASRSTTVIPLSSRPATRSHGNPSGRAASSPHQCRRYAVTTALTSCRSPTSDRTRHTVGFDGTGPITGLRWRRPLEIADRLPAQDLRHGHVDQDLAAVIDRVETRSGHRRRQPGTRPGPLD